MGFESNTGLGVVNHYGARDTGKTAGVVKTEGRKEQISVDIDVETIANGGSPVVPVTIPASSTIEKVYARVTEAFTLTGTTPTIEIGTEGSEATNGANLSEAQAEAVGTYDLTSTLGGTWANPLAADTEVGVALGGTTPATSGAAGKVRVVIEYTKMTI